MEKYHKVTASDTKGQSPYITPILLIVHVVKILIDLKNTVFSEKGVMPVFNAQITLGINLTEF